MSNDGITQTDFNFPGQTAVYHGKVRDVYTINDKYLVLVASDRISAFDVILPRAIPGKGQILTQMAEHFLQATKDIAPNWLLDMPDPQASLGLKCEPFKVEMVIRGALVGHAWREYKTGKRELCGAIMPDGLNEFDKFEQPIITPTTKADEGHDEDISAEEIVKQGIVSQEDWDKLSELTFKLFARGQAMAEERGLVLADTKYEFGKLNGKIYVIDEIHTADSARYFYKDSYDAFISEQSTETPKHLSKEFVREWLMENNFSGQEGQQVPKMTDEVVANILERYAELFEQLTGKKFVAASTENQLSRIEKNVVGSLKELQK